MATNANANRKQVKAGFLSRDLSLLETLEVLCHMVYF